MHGDLFKRHWMSCKNYIDIFIYILGKVPWLMNYGTFVKFPWSIFFQSNTKCWCFQHKHRSSNARISIPSWKDYRFTRNMYFDQVHCWLFTKMYHQTIPMQYIQRMTEKHQPYSSSFKTLPEAMTSFNELYFIFTSLNWRVTILPSKCQKLPAHVATFTSQLQQYRP